MNVAQIELAHSDGMPALSVGFVPDASDLGFRSGLEDMALALPTHLARPDIMTGLGTLEAGQAVSYPKMLLDAEIVTYLDRVLEGVQSTTVICPSTRSRRSALGGIISHARTRGFGSERGSTGARDSLPGFPMASGSERRRARSIEPWSRSPGYLRSMCRRLFHRESRSRSRPYSGRPSGICRTCDLLACRRTSDDRLQGRRVTRARGGFGPRVLPGSRPPYSLRCA